MAIKGGAHASSLFTILQAHTASTHRAFILSIRTHKPHTHPHSTQRTTYYINRHQSPDIQSLQSTSTASIQILPQRTAPIYRHLHRPVRQGIPAKGLTSSALVARYQPATAMPPSNGQNQVIDTVSFRYGFVVARSAHLQGQDEEYSFRFRPDLSIDGSTEEFDTKGELIKEVVGVNRREMFADNAKVTLVSKGGYSKTDWIDPGWTEPRPA